MGGFVPQNVVWMGPHHTYALLRWPPLFGVMVWGLADVVTRAMTGVFSLLSGIPFHG